MSSPKKANSALLEIGVEEVPARFLTPALENLKNAATTHLQTAGLEFTSIETFGTPRRLVLLIKGLSDKAKDRTDVMVGPPPKAAKNEKGEWTPAATGFAKSQGVAVEKLVLQNTPKGERYVHLQSVKGLKAEQILPTLFTTLIQTAEFPKSMVWEESQFRFARPLRWIVALYNNKVVRIKIAGVSSDKNTVGLLSMGGRKIPVTKIEQFKSLLQGRCILVDQNDRQKQIRQQLETLSKKLKAHVVLDDDHVNEVVFITEYPVSIVGKFEEAYLSLPREVLVTVLKKHQKFFPLENSKGELINQFIGVRNGPSQYQDVVREGYERVLRARLADAKFFFDVDSKEKLETLVPKLSGIGFHEKLGSMLEKTNRVTTLTKKLGGALNLSAATIQKAERASLLSKCDLLTQMVGELPELQGIAGRFYAMTQEDKEVALAIEQHYWPLTAAGTLPQSEISSLVSLADKLDTLAANFSVGLQPSGSADPYGLRRMGIGLVRLLIEKGWTLSVDALVKLAFEGLQKEGRNLTAAEAELKTFLVQRFSSWYENQGFQVDEIEAVASQTHESFAVMSKKLSALKGIRGQAEFFSLAAAIKRARNILTQAKEKGLLPEEKSGVQLEVSGQQEKNLLSTLNQVEPQIQNYLKDNNFPQALLQLVHLKEPIDAFFEGVKVMSEDEKERNERLSLLNRVKNLFDSLADFSKLLVARQSAS